MRICCAHQAEQSLLVTLLPVSLFTAPEKPWLHAAVSPDFICVRDFSRTAKLFFDAQLNEICGCTHTHTRESTHKPDDTQGQTRTHRHTHTCALCRGLPFLQAVALLILSDLKFVCSLLQRAPSMIPALPGHPSTIIPPLSFPSLLRSAALPRPEQPPNYPYTHTQKHTQADAHTCAHGPYHPAPKEKKWKIMK